MPSMETTLGATATNAPILAATRASTSLAPRPIGARLSAALRSLLLLSAIAQAFF